MRTWIAALLFLPATGGMAIAMEAVSQANAPAITRQFAATPPDTPQVMAGHRADDRSAIEETAWEAEAMPTADQRRRFSRLQTDELASRLGFQDGKMNWAHFDLKDSEGNGPAIAGTFDGGAAKMVLHWKQN